MEQKVHSEIPLDIRRLILWVVRGFYGVEHFILVDTLLRHPCMKEDDLAMLLNFDKKQMRALLNALRVDKFLKERIKMENEGEGLPATKNHYYYINFQGAINVINYRLDSIRRKIEAEERETTSRASFICPQCHKEFSDLDIKDLLDPMTGNLCCTHCRFEVQEDESSVRKGDVRSLLATFNEQMTPLFELLSKCNKIKLSNALLQPDPVNFSIIRARVTGKQELRSEGGEHWSGETSRKSSGFGFTEMTTEVVIGGETEKKESVKEKPVWLTHSTVDNSDVLGEDTVDASKSVPVDQPIREYVWKDTDEVTRLLLLHEKKDSAPALSQKPPESTERDRHFVQGWPGEVEETSDESGSTEEREVCVQGKTYDYDDVTQEMVELMTAREKEAYIKMGQALYESMYE